MIRVVLTMDPQTGAVNVESAAPPALVNVMIDLAKGAVLQAAAEHVVKQATAGIARPTGDQVKSLLSAR